MADRRSFLQFMGLLSGWVIRLHSNCAAPLPPSSIYEELGVQPFINAGGAFTNFGGALMRDEVLQTMQEVSRHSISITELQEAVGKQIATMLGCEAALVTAGCASALALATAACVAGKDPEKIHRIPDASGMKNEVVVQKTHRFEYDHAIRNVGAKFVEIETSDELKAVISDRTAMLFFVNSFDAKGKIHREEFARLANGLKIPALIDAAADLPPVENPGPSRGWGTIWWPSAGVRASVDRNVRVFCSARRDWWKQLSSTTHRIPTAWGGYRKWGKKKSLGCIERYSCSFGGS